MRRHFASGFPRALLSLSQEKSSGVEIAFIRNLLYVYYYHLFRTLCPRNCGRRENKEMINHIRELDLNPEFLLNRNRFFPLYH